MPLTLILFSFNGRISRKTFWLTLLGLSFANAVFGIIIDHSGSNALILKILWTPLGLWTSIAFQVKRWHDRGKTGFMVLCNLIPILGIFWSLIELGFLKGTEGINSYGKNPLTVA